MRFLGLVLLTLVNVLMYLIAPFLVPVALLFARKVDDTCVHNDQPLIQRYKLPWIFKWLETPDELFPCDVSLPKMNSIYHRYGWFIAAWVWAGFRNVGFGINWQFGKPATNYMACLSDDEKLAQGVFENVYTFGFLKLLVGYAIYRDWYNTKTVAGFWAVPRISLRFNK